MANKFDGRNRLYFIDFILIQFQRIIIKNRITGVLSNGMIRMLVIMDISMYVEVVSGSVGILLFC